MTPSSCSYPWVWATQRWDTTHPTMGSQGLVIQKRFMDDLTDIITGRRPLSDYDQLVRDWQAGGGEQARTELLQAMRA